ncbi:MAG: hypothetical protein HN952_08105 [Candidatus Cloacimonetes bacterium]|jgi:hypothetical protein|nr:hypothetical protein [Candidatus Cloacimonadota bacterium]MBT6994896.1 hypothetical protein [Candidatus Cloacimonadota bacterium]MBT7468841.1 hypothetical protein [Candidatus Cloacimonadota bacterium]
MKRGIFLQIFIILIILIIWNLAHLGYDWQREHCQTELSKIPMILISSDDNAFSSLKTKIDTLNFIKSAVIQADSTISQNLLHTYGLVGIEEILSNLTLPNIMKIKFNITHFGILQKAKLEKIISKNQEDIILIYDHDFWKATQVRLTLLTKAYYLLNVFIIAVLLFLTIFIRFHFAIISQEKWKIKRALGGSRKSREKSFWLTSLWLLLIPFTLIFGGYFAVNHFGLLKFEIATYKFGIEFGTLLLIILISRITLRKTL